MMTPAWLVDLLERMTVKEGIVSSSESVSWKAYREAELVADASVAGELAALIGQSSKEKRSAIYFILGAIAKNAGSAECTDILLARCKAETDKYVLSYVLEALTKRSVDATFDFSVVRAFASDSRWLVRLAAINALGCQTTPENEQALLGVLAGNSNPNEVPAVHAALGKIGSPNALGAIRANLKSRERDIKGSAQFAIDAIKARHGLPQG